MSGNADCLRNECTAEEPAQPLCPAALIRAFQKACYTKYRAKKPLCSPAKHFRPAGTGASLCAAAANFSGAKDDRSAHSADTALLFSWGEVSPCAGNVPPRVGNVTRCGSNKVPPCGSSNVPPCSVSPFRFVPVILCIGTDRLIGDCLGPLTGSLLAKRSAGALPVYGTLRCPVHARNLSGTIDEIKKKHPDSVILAVDASLGKPHCVGSVLVRAGSLQPGAGVHKNLPPAGDVSITGIAGEQSSQPFLALQTARLSTVMDMAEQICGCILSVCAGSASATLQI